MALDVKSRSKRYEKLDFLGEGQVRMDKPHAFLTVCRTQSCELDASFGCLSVARIRVLLLSTKLCSAITNMSVDVKISVFCSSVCHRL